MSWLLLVGLLQHDSGTISSYDLQTSRVETDIQCEEMLMNAKIGFGSYSSNHAIVGRCVPVGEENVEVGSNMMFTNYLYTGQIDTFKIQFRSRKYYVTDSSHFRDSSIRFIKFGNKENCVSAAETWNSAVKVEITNNPKFLLSKKGFKTIAKCF